MMADATQGKEPLSAAFLEQLIHLPDTTTVCLSKQQQLPPGWVIIGETVLYQAAGEWPNGWVLKKPEEFETVCDISPIPDGYVKLEKVGSPACPGVWPNAWKIERSTSAANE